MNYHNYPILRGNEGTPGGVVSGPFKGYAGYVIVSSVAFSTDGKHVVDFDERIPHQENSWPT